MQLPKTYKEAFSRGWRVVAVTTCAGYLSRKLDIWESEIKEAKKGKYKGMLYFESPSYESASTHYRNYLELDPGVLNFDDQDVPSPPLGEEE